MNRKIRLLYIDDEIDNLLSEYLEPNFTDTQVAEGSPWRYEYDELEFQPDFQYKNFLNNEKLRRANILIIDSRLFKNNNSQYHYKGEEIELLIRKVFPFIEVIIVTQNEMDEEYDVVKKFGSNSESDRSVASKYYDKELLPIIRTKAKTIISRQTSVEVFKKNAIWEELVKEKVINSLNSMLVYDELTKNDIDQLIKSFQQLEKQLREHR